MYRYILLVSCGLFLAACATQEKEPTRADLMRGHAQDSQSRVDLKNEIARDWERGQQLLNDGQRRINAGENRVEAAEENLARGREQIRRGTEELNEGRRMVEDAERRFQQNFPELELEEGAR